MRSMSWTAGREVSGRKRNCREQAEANVAQAKTTGKFRERRAGNDGRPDGAEHPGKRGQPQTPRAMLSVPG